MFIVRPLQRSDIDAMHSFAKASSYGIENIPLYRPRLKKLIENSCNSFEQSSKDKTNAIYTFILEDNTTAEAIGTCSIIACTGIYKPVCNFHVITDNGTPVGLQLKQENIHASELCGLYLMPNHRHSGLGKLLSLCRLLFIAAHSQHFSSTLRADMRGNISKEGTNAFWDAVGARYYKCSLAEMLRKMDREEIQPCTLLPNTLIPWNTLGTAAQNTVGTTHPNTQPALHMLTDEGFAFHNVVNVLDAGPVISCSIQQLKTLKESHCAPLAATVTHLDTDTPYALLSNEQLHSFRACQARLSLDAGGHPTLEAATADALKLKIGQSLRYRILHHTP